MGVYAHAKPGLYIYSFDDYQFYFRPYQQLFHLILDWITQQIINRENISPRLQYCYMQIFIMPSSTIGFFTGFYLLFALLLLLIKLMSYGWYLTIIIREIGNGLSLFKMIIYLVRSTRFIYNKHVAFVCDLEMVFCNMIQFIFMLIH